MDLITYPLQSFAVCLGADARAANEAARRKYKYQLEKREREWMQTLSLTKVEHVQHEQLIDSSNLALANAYSDIQEKHGQLVDQMFASSQEDWKKFLQQSKGADLKAAGRLGRSSERLSALEFGEYMKRGNDKARQLTEAGQALSREGAKAASATRAQQMQSFTNVAFVKNPDMVPPQPVMRNVGHAMFMDALKIGSSVAGMAMPFVV